VNRDWKRRTIGSQFCPPREDADENGDGGNTHCTTRSPSTKEVKWRTEQIH
jgi:hypothetical protein